MSASCFATTGQLCSLLTPQRGDTFEVHVTTAPLSGAALADFQAVCRTLRVKSIVIEVGAGLPTQPMTCLRVIGDLDAALNAGRTLAAELHSAGFPAVRLKIEAAPWNVGVPVTDEAAAHEPPGRYFEHHLRLVLDGEPPPALSAVCRMFGAHLSRNPFKVRGDGRRDWFVTSRQSGVGRVTAEASAERLARHLTQAGCEIAAQITEYCVFDDHRALDADWEDAVWEAR